MGEVFADDQEGAGAVSGDSFGAPAEEVGFEAPFFGYADDDQVGGLGLFSAHPMWKAPLSHVSIVQLPD